VKFPLNTPQTMLAFGALGVMCAAVILGVTAVGLSLAGKGFSHTVFVAFFLALALSLLLSVARRVVDWRERRGQP
jgi:uncharacterized membrane protein YvlD (DUF360 family)